MFSSPCKFPLLSKRFPHAQHGPKMALLLPTIWRKISSFDNDVVWLSPPKLHRNLFNHCQCPLMSKGVVSSFNFGWIACEYFTRDMSLLCSEFLCSKSFQLWEILRNKCTFGNISLFFERKRERARMTEWQRQRQRRKIWDSCVQLKSMDRNKILEAFKNWSLKSYYNL